MQCDRCDAVSDTKTVVVGEATNHLNTVVINQKDATCTKPGYTGDTVFDMAERFINNEVPKQIDIIGTLSFNYFNNRKKIQIEIFDYLSIKKEKTPFMESLESLLTL